MLPESGPGSPLPAANFRLAGTLCEAMASRLQRGLAVTLACNFCDVDAKLPFWAKDGLTSTSTIPDRRLPNPVMPSFLLRFDDASRAFHKATEQSGECDALLDSWRVFRKIAAHLESGTAYRLENLARRLGYLQQLGQRKQNRFKEYDWNTRTSSTKAGVTPVPSESAQIITRKRKSRSRRSSSVATMQDTVHLPATPDHQFCGLDLSLLSAPHNLSSKPIIQLSLDLRTSNPNNAFTTSYDNDNNDPNELFILPKLHPFSLQSIPELSDDEFEHGPSTPRASSPVLFVNPFGAPSRNHQLPSPPQTPSQSLSECIPPHLKEEEEEEDSQSRSEPINLTGRIKKLMDPPIAFGGTSDIFYGEWQLPAPKRVAVKVLRTTSTNSVTTVQRRLRREMRLWWMCRHRNVVPLYGYASDFGGMDAMISPWMKNGSALTYIKAQKCSWAERLRMLGDIVAGLKYLHHFEPPIVHGDLKPTNVLISDNGDACLCDFGLSRIIKSEAGASGFTTSNFAGSIRYMSPELLNSEDEDALPLVTAASDVYALGCVGLQIVTDHIPYANRNLDAQVMHDIIRGIPPARRPSLASITANSITVTGGGGGGAKHSLPKFWDLVTATWVPSPSNRPDIVHVAHLLAECRVPHAGPQLRAGAEHALVASLPVGSATYGGSSSVFGSSVGHRSSTLASSTHISSPLGGRVQPRSSTSTSSLSRSSSSLSSSTVRRGRQESAFRVPIGGGVGVGGGVSRPSVHDEKPIPIALPISASVLKRSLSAGSAPIPIRNVPFASSTISTVHLQSRLPSTSMTSAAAPSISGSTSTSTSTSTSGSGKHLASSDTLHRLRRSTSAAGAVLRGSLIHKRPGSSSSSLPLTSMSPGGSFRASVNAVEQVWYDR